MSGIIHNDWNQKTTKKLIYSANRIETSLETEMSKSEAQYSNTNDLFLQTILYICLIYTMRV